MKRRTFLTAIASLIPASLLKCGESPKVLDCAVGHHKHLYPLVDQARVPVLNCDMESLNGWHNFWEANWRREVDLWKRLAPKA